MRLPGRQSLLVWLAGVVCAFICLGLGAAVVVEGGLYDVAATTPDPAVQDVAVHTAMIKSVESRAAIEAPSRFTPAQIEAGLRDYDASCSMCHGGPGVARAPFAQGMNPSPPYLIDASRHWRARELYWIVSHGVKMTAMPAWRSIRTDAQIWDIVAFLEAAPYITLGDYDRIRSMPVLSGRGGRPIESVSKKLDSSSRQRRPATLLQRPRQIVLRSIPEHLRVAPASRRE